MQHTSVENQERKKKSFLERCCGFCCGSSDKRRNIRGYYSSAQDDDTWAFGPESGAVLIDSEPVIQDRPGHSGNNGSEYQDCSLDQSGTNDSINNLFDRGNLNSEDSEAHNTSHHRPVDYDSGGLDLKYSRGYDSGVAGCDIGRDYGNVGVSGCVIRDDDTGGGCDIGGGDTGGRCDSGDRDTGGGCDIGGGDTGGRCDSGSRDTGGGCDSGGGDTGGGCDSGGGDTGGGCDSGGGDTGGCD